MAFPKIKISDDSGNTVDVTSNRLDVNAYLSATPTIDIGDVSLLLGGTAADTGLGVYGAQTLRVTMAADDPLLTIIATNIADSETLLGSIVSLVGNSMNSQRTTGDAFVDGGYGTLSHSIRNDVLAAQNLVIDGDYSPLQTNAKGALYATGGEVENAAVQSEPLLIGGRFDSSARTLGNGDAGAVALNASGHVLMDVVDGGQLDTIIDTLETTLTAIETDQAAIETLLTGIDSDTDAIKTATQLIDDAVADEGAALGKGILIQADDGSDRQNLQMSGTGHLKVTLQGVAYAVNASNPFKADKNAYTEADIGISAKVKRSDTLANLTNVADGDWTSLQVSDTGALYTTHGVTGGADGVTTVSSAGTDVVLGGDVDCKKIDIQAQTDNTGLISVGFTGVDATEATGTGVILYAGDTYSLEINNLNLIYIDSTVSGEGVRYTYFT